MYKGTRWEYNVVKTSKDYQPDINALGWEGWGLIAVVPTHEEAGFQNYKMFFKRELKK